MSTIISLHSFRGGTGKTNITANLAALMAAKGLRVAIVDADLPSPGMHALFGMREDEISRSLNGFLNKEYGIADAVYDVTQRLGVHVKGKLILIPSSMVPAEIMRITKDGFDYHIMHDGFDELIEDYKLDFLFVDTHPGLDDELLLTMAVSDALMLIMRPDQQDYQGAHATIQMINKLNIPDVSLLVNMMPRSLEVRTVKSEIEKVYQKPISQIIPYSEELMTLASSAVFALHYPNHPVSSQFRELAEHLFDRLKAASSF